MKKTKDEQLSALRREYWKRELLLSLQIRHAEIEDAYLTRASMRELDRQISELIWNGAKLRQLVLPELSENLMDAIWALHTAEKEFFWDVIDHTRLHVRYTMWDAAKGGREACAVILNAPSAKTLAQTDLVYIDGRPVILKNWIKDREEEQPTNS